MKRMIFIVSVLFSISSNAEIGGVFKNIPEFEWYNYITGKDGSGVDSLVQTCKLEIEIQKKRVVALGYKIVNETPCASEFDNAISSSPLYRVYGRIQFLPALAAE